LLKRPRIPNKDYELRYSGTSARPGIRVRGVELAIFRASFALIYNHVVGALVSRCVASLTYFVSPEGAIRISFNYVFIERADAISKGRIIGSITRARETLGEVLCWTFVLEIIRNNEITAGHSTQVGKNSSRVVWSM